MALEPGKTFDDRYAIETLIGRGGMGEVYVATDLRLRRKIALKVVREDKDSPGAVARLRREARAIAAFSHPNVVAVHDVGEDGGMCFVVMELVSGESLYARMEQRAKTSLAQKMGWLVAVARALACAHSAGVIHRDVKPTNIMISDTGVVKVVDFGLARTLAPTSFLTQGESPLGTPSYMAPEQLMGAEADERSDQYAFGMTAYRLLSDAYPGRLAKQPRLLSDFVADISPAIAAVISRTLAFDAEGRFARMSDVADALEALANKTLEAVAPQRVETTLPDPETTLPSRTERDPERQEVSSAMPTTATVVPAVVEATLDATNPGATALMPKEMMTTEVMRPMTGGQPKLKTLPLRPLAPRAATSGSTTPSRAPPEKSRAMAIVVLLLIAALLVAAGVSIFYVVRSFGSGG